MTVTTGGRGSEVLLQHAPIRCLALHRVVEQDLFPELDGRHLDHVPVQEAVHVRGQAPLREEEGHDGCRVLAELVGKLGDRHAFATEDLDILLRILGLHVAAPVETGLAGASRFALENFPFGSGTKHRRLSDVTTFSSACSSPAPPYQPSGRTSDEASNSCCSSPGGGDRG